MLARRAGTSHSTLAAYESGTKAPRLTTLLRLLHAAGFDLRNELVPLDPFEDRTRQGERLESVLELAEAFPTRHEPTITYPRFPEAP